MEVKYDFKQLDVYKEAKGLVKNVYAYMRKFPKEEQFALCDQLRRAVISIPSNIAEGSGRRSSKEQVHFLEIAFGSLCEVDCQLDVACDLGYMSRAEYEILVSGLFDKDDAEKIDVWYQLEMNIDAIVEYIIGNLD